LSVHVVNRDGRINGAPSVNGRDILCSHWRRGTLTPDIHVGRIMTGGGVWRRYRRWAHQRCSGLEGGGVATWRGRHPSCSNHIHRCCAASSGSIEDVAERNPDGLRGCGCCARGRLTQQSPQRLFFAALPPTTESPMSPELRILGATIS
jgi:hypothetical protein